MAINTFLKDCNHTDPKIRGMALRNLCSLRFNGVLEYLQPRILEGLKDLNAYVRKTAVIGCIKLFYLSPDAVKNSDLTETLYQMISDTDPLVVLNVIEALREILADEGGIATSSKMIIYLLNRLKEFHEYGQVTVL